MTGIDFLWNDKLKKPIKRMGLPIEPELLY